MSWHDGQDPSGAGLQTAQAAIASKEASKEDAQTAAYFWTALVAVVGRIYNRYVQEISNPPRSCLRVGEKVETSVTAVEPKYRILFYHTLS